MSSWHARPTVRTHDEAHTLGDPLDQRPLGRIWGERIGEKAVKIHTPEGQRALALLEAAAYHVDQKPKGLTAMSRGVPRNHRGSFYVWSRDGLFPVIITRDFTDVAHFAYALPREQRAIEKAARQRWEAEVRPMAADDRWTQHQEPAPHGEPAG